jgi:hypothetical protein
MVSVVSSHFSMQEEGFLEYIDARCHLYTLLVTLKIIV